MCALASGTTCHATRHVIRQQRHSAARSLLTPGGRQRASGGCGRARPARTMLPLSLAEAALVLASLAALGGAGWAFVNARLYREESERDAVAQARP